MRDIVFRGKYIDNGEWIAGSLHLIGEDAYIFTDHVFTEGPCWCAVDPKTIGQYVGREDKHGTKIFEGDILKLRFSGPSEVKFADGSFFMEGTAIPFRYADRFEIIGNIHDNPELLEVEE